MTRSAPEPLAAAYAAGFFPMGDPSTGKVSWYSPDPRTLLPLEGFHASRTLSRVIRSGRFRVSADEAFEAVVAACGGREPTWITPRMKVLYRVLRAGGFARSVESWDGERLAGGVFGVAVGGAFFAESMFHRAPNAGMVALAALVDRLRKGGFSLLDVQLPTEHLGRCGAREVPRPEFLKRLARAVERPGRWG